MADRRMFSKTIIDSDAFLDMPLSAQCLYFHLSMRADDEGFVNNPKKIQRMIGASDDDLKLLIAKQFVLVFETGIIVIKHWKIHNYIRGDRLNKTAYQDEKHMLVVKENGAYDWQSDVSQMSGRCLPSDCQMSAQDRLGKVRLDQDRLGKNICSEPLESKRSKQEAKTPSDYNILLNDGTEYNVPLEDIEKYKHLYQAVDVEAELRRMIGWCDSNNTRRKTLKGVKKFINGWLSRTQDSGKAVQKQVTNKQIDTKQAYQQHEYKASDFDDSFYYDPTKDYGEA